MVIPEYKDTVWSMRIKDGEGDIIFIAEDYEGRLDDRKGLPVGRDKPEKLSVSIYEATSNEKFSVIFKVKEAR